MLKPMPSGLQRPNTTNLPDIPANAKHGFADMSHGRTHYVTWQPTGGKQKLVKPASGNGSTPVVLVHGFSYAEAWYPIAGKLSEQGYTVIAYDNYGRGYSDAPDVPHTGALYVAQLAQLLLHLGYAQVDLGGVSQGGAIVTLFAQTYPHMIRRLILLCPAGLPVDAPFLSKVVALPVVGEWAMRYGFPRTINKTAQQLFEHPNEEMSKTMQEYMQKNIIDNPGYLRSLLATIRDFPMSELEPVITELGKTFKSPALLIWGTADKLVPYSNHTKFQELWPSVKFISLENGNHLFLAERADETLQHIIAFIK